jgi:hypothetical protein
MWLAGGYHRLFAPNGMPLTGTGASTLISGIRFHLGDESSFAARR